MPRVADVFLSELIFIDKGVGGVGGGQKRE